MKFLDKFLQKCRIQKATPYIAPGMSVLDIGCYDGALFQALQDSISWGIGVDPLEHPFLNDERFRRIIGSFPQDTPCLGQFDVITMLAVLEHFPFHELQALPFHCAKYLKPGGLLIITVPSPLVDQILKYLKWVRLIDGMSLEEHYGFTIETVPLIFCREFFDLKVRKSFQFGLNNLFVFQKK